VIFSHGSYHLFVKLRPILFDCCQLLLCRSEAVHVVEQLQMGLVVAMVKGGALFKEWVKVGHVGGVS
jgi:hypothetical protein